MKTAIFCSSSWMTSANCLMLWPLHAAGHIHVLLHQQNQAWMLKQRSWIVTVCAAPYSPGVLLYLFVLHAPIQNTSLLNWEGNYKQWSSLNYINSCPRVLKVLFQIPTTKCIIWKNTVIIVSDCSLYDLHYRISAIFITLPSYFYNDENDVCGIITSLCLCSLWIIFNHEYLNIFLPTLFQERPLYFYTSSFLSIHSTVESMVTSELGALKDILLLIFLTECKTISGTSSTVSILVCCK